MYVIVKIAPADTEEVPILNKQKRKVKKVVSLISLITFYIIAFIVRNDFLYKIILIVILYTDLTATKIAYRLFRCKYSFESDEFKDYFNDI